MALSNTIFDEYLVAIFGKEKLCELKKKAIVLKGTKREQVVVNELLTVLAENKANYILQFRFYCKEMKRTSHYIIFVTKHRLGYKIMKEIMYENSNKDVDGVATFEYKDRFNFASQSEQLSILPRPLEELCDLLSKEYSGKRVNVGDICSRIVLDVNNRFVVRNVQEALRRLETIGVVKIEGRIRETRNGEKTMPTTAYAEFI